MRHKLRSRQLMEGRRGAGRRKAAAAAGQVSSSSSSSSSGESHLGEEAWQAVESEPRSSPGKVNLFCLQSSTRHLLIEILSHAQKYLTQNCTFSCLTKNSGKL